MDPDPDAESASHAGGADPFDTSDLPVDDADELAGIVDLFGALTRQELTTALVELAYRQRGDVDDPAVRAAAADAVTWAVERYHLVAYAPANGDGDGDGDGNGNGNDSVEAAHEGVDADGPDDRTRAAERRLTVGPVSFPTLPPGADDLPHILAYPTRSVARESLAEVVESRLRGDAARAVAAGDDDRIRRLLDVTYDFEAWAPVDVSEIRRRLDDALAAADAESDPD